MTPRPFREPMPLDERAQLVGRACTLNGEPAIVAGWRAPFATVRQVRTGLSAEWAWTTAARLLERGGAFES